MLSREYRPICGSSWRIPAPVNESPRWAPRKAQKMIRFVFGLAVRDDDVGLRVARSPVQRMGR